MSGRSRGWSGGAWALASVVLLAGCHPSSGASAEDAAVPPPSKVTFPAGFFFGSSTAGFQVERDDSNTDWAAWVATPGKIVNGDNPNDGGPDSLGHVSDDIANLVASGQNAYRFSIEWGRVYPTAEAFMNDTPDPAGVAAYTQLLTQLRAAHVEPFVTLAHFALPSWLSDGLVANQNDPQGWERPGTQAAFATWCSRAAARWGGLVDWWLTINEPLPYALGGFVQGSFPPGVVLQVDRALAVVKTEARAHAACFDAIHAADKVDADGDGKAARVSVAKHQRTFHPYDPTASADAAAAAHVDYIWNQWFLNAIVKGDWDDDLDGKYTGSKDIVGDPTLKGRADYLGINYYSDTLVSATRGLIIPVINAAIYQGNLPTGRPETDFAWDIYPEGLGTVLDQAATYHLPIAVTENGLADGRDVNRARFLLEHLYQLGWANQRSDDVIGYFHWALVDNFEWANGFCPHFGLFSYDMTTGARTAKGSVSTYAAIAKGREITTAQVAAAPKYVAPILCTMPP